MINNFDVIKSFLFDEELEKGLFYFVQVIQRRKENPDIKKNSKVIKSFYIFNKEQLEEKKDIIIKLCHVFNARAYITVNTRDSRKVCMEMIKNLVSNIESENYMFANITDSACGNGRKTNKKQWIVDIDSHDDSYLMKVADKIKEINKYVNYFTVKTLNGFHLVTTVFNLQLFKSEFPEIDVHKDSSTLLYYNDEIKIN